MCREMQGVSSIVKVNNQESKVNNQESISQIRHLLFTLKVACA